MILEKLFSGEFYASEQFVPKSEEYREENVAVSNIMSILFKRLNTEDFALVEELHNHLLSANFLESEAYFTYGVTVGIKLMIEVHAILDN